MPTALASASPVVAAGAVRGSEHDVVEGEVDAAPLVLCDHLELLDGVRRKR